MIFTKSETFKEEYSCRVVRIGPVNPIENSDFLGWTLIGSSTVVVRKDEVKEGDLMFYLSRETQISQTFAHNNNLYMFDHYEMNANAEEVKAILEKAESETNEKEKEKLISKAKTMCGYISNKSRIRAAKLRGVVSAGFLFTKDALIKWKPELADYFKEHSLEELEGVFFDTVEGDLLCKAYVPKKPRGKRKPRRLTRVERRVKKYFGWLPEKAQRRIVRIFQKPKRKLSKKEKRVANLKYFLPNHFDWHYDTNMFGDNVWKFSPDDVVVISPKFHGSSGIYSHTLRSFPVAEQPKKNVIINKLVKTLHLPKSWIRIETYEDYDYIYSTRNVIQNKDMNPRATVYDGKDIYKQYNDIFKETDALDKGMIVYGEIAGYFNGESKTIQTTGGCSFDYGCNKGESFFMPYRITTEEPDGKKREWNVLEVCEWTKKFLEKHPEYVGKFLPIPILYHGKLGDLYPELDTNTHWHENLVMRMKSDENFCMEMDEPLCNNKCPREGICIRKDDDPEPECFKLKAEKFYKLEEKAVDKGEIADIEMLEEYGPRDDDSDDTEV